ncbi:uncharacterized protein LOC21406501 isoform X1 [Morus notabilis]|uniref:uncharacterized protein LOC21406501 isoform X1 n=3 Tax=Morus notabilis TaxID=981085 RepID=UPI000CED3966|nr:uncharacterized protein LOC21406501 isoform X1 [Morus notabilis]XP_024018729.1 uncharacterized protein LOC21406501 isoform X1 [Morus notabilis]
MQLQSCCGTRWLKGMRITEGKTTQRGSHIDRSGFAFNIWVSSSGWAEGECKGKAGWFPFNYVERRERVLATKVAKVFCGYPVVELFLPLFLSEIFVSSFGNLVVKQWR